jgi:hypothetical protein
MNTKEDADGTLLSLPTCYAFEVGDAVIVNDCMEAGPYIITSRGTNAFIGPNYSGTNAMGGRIKRVLEHFLSKHNAIGMAAGAAVPPLNRD